VSDRLPHGEVSDVDDGGRVILEEAHCGELVGLQLPRRGHHERGGRAGVAEDQRRRGERDDEGARGRGQHPAHLGGDQLGEPPRPRRGRGDREGAGGAGGLVGRRARKVPEGMARAARRGARGEEAGGGRGGGGHLALRACGAALQGSGGSAAAVDSRGSGGCWMMSGRRLAPAVFLDFFFFGGNPLIFSQVVRLTLWSMLMLLHESGCLTSPWVRLVIRMIQRSYLVSQALSRLCIYITVFLFIKMSRTQK
jgi:hypothetical protein